MTVASFQLEIYLLLPGFIFIYAAFLLSRFRNLPVFQGTALSLLVSLILFATIYSLYTSSVKPPSDQPWPDLIGVLGNPALVPGWVWAAVYVSAPLLGSLIGFLDRKRFFESLFRFAGIDLRQHGDVWGRLLRESSYVRVYLDDGTLLFGWPEFFSTDRSQPGPELYLSQAQIWDSNSSEWVLIADVEGILLDASKINRIEFVSDTEGRQE